MPSVTVRDVLRLALPLGTQVAAGSAGVGRQVTWVATLRATLPAFAELRGGELALLSVDAARDLDLRLSLAVLVRRLAQAPVPVAGVVALGSITAEDAAAAEEGRLPLLQLPNGADLREVEREITRLIADYEAQFERRSAQLYDLLTQRSLSGQGLPSLLDTLAERTGQGVACYAPNGELRSQRSKGSARIALQALRPSGKGELNLLNQQIWIEPIGPSDYPTGYLALARQRARRLGPRGRPARRRGPGPGASQGAGRPGRRGAPARRLPLKHPRRPALRHGRRHPARPGARLQPDPAAHGGLINLEDANPAALGRIASSVQSELSRRGINAPISRRDTSILTMLPIGGSARPRELVEQLRDRMAADYPGIAVAIGGQVAALGEWRRTLEEAEQALILCRQLFGTARVLAFSDLGVYRLLVRLRETPELWTFYRETLSKLADYDTRQGAELIKTLEAYFAHLGNLRATSEALHVHRNTLLYRLERIKEISGMDLDNSEEHFALWLALRAHRVLSTLEE